MHWRFLDSNILEETESGYQIHLLSGTWFHPGKLKPCAAIDIEADQQMSLLRSGLKHIRSIGETKKQQRAEKQALGKA